MAKNSELDAKIEIHHKNIEMVRNEIAKVIVGQDILIEKLLIALMVSGHVLLEGFPGLAKTLIIETLAKILDIKFKRIQFTPDLLPSDLTGSLVYNQEIKEFVPQKGPVFTNFLMADEINRAPAKVQSALLECMQERKVTIGNFSFPLEEPFLVMATQNPIEHEGTFELPEAQKDRFMFKIIVNYPDKGEELKIINRIALSEKPSIKTLVDKSHIKDWNNLIKEIYVDEKIKKYVIDIVFATRDPENHNLRHMKHLIKLGVSPRASIYMITAAQAKAFISKRSFVIPEDVYEIATEIMQHRVILSYEAMAESVGPADVIKEVLKKIKVP